MSERKDAIQKHTADQLALERHILEAVERQREHDDLRADVRANKVVIEIERTLRQHIAALEALAETYDVGAEGFLKKAVSEALGAVAGLYDKMREHSVSRLLRDNYTALSLAAMGYTAYNAFGLAIKEDTIAQLAEQHLRDLTPLLVEISKVLPHTVVREVAEENDEFPVDTTVGLLAEQRTQKAWEPSVTEV